MAPAGNRSPKQRPTALRALLGLVMAVLSGWVQAEAVELRLDSGIIAQANLHRGEPGKPAVVILHGFLQTNQFPTVQYLADALADDGYTVLTPNLSLDIERRGQSLACEAIHTHTMEGETAELRAWIEWLAALTPAPIVVIGHSTGGIQVLAQTVTRPHPRTRAIILISPTYFGAGPVNVEGPEDQRRAEEDLTQGRRDPQTYALTFCQRYLTLPAAYLSYLYWDAARSLEAIQGLSGVRVVLIVGLGDDRLDSSWVAHLEATGTRVLGVEGADHFFESGHELELGDAVEESLRYLDSEP